MELSFSIREYTNSMRSCDMDKCWPFAPEEKNRSLPSMDVRKHRWWGQELDRKAKQRSPKKRSITELFAMAPQITTIDARSKGPDEDHALVLNTSNQVGREAIADDAEKEKKPKRKKRKIRSEIIQAVESKSDDQEREQEVEKETMEDRDMKIKKKKKKLKRKKKLEVQIHFQTKFNSSDHESCKMDTSSEGSKGDLEVKTKCQTTKTGTDNGNVGEEPDEVLLPLISILKKCKRKKDRTKKGKGVTFSGIDGILGPDKDTMACPVGAAVSHKQNEDKDSKNEDKDACSKCNIDLNEALPEPIDLNNCLEEHFMEAFNCVGNSTGVPGLLEPNIRLPSSDETSSLPLNSLEKMCQPSSALNKKSEPVVNLNSDLSTISTIANVCSEQQPQMVMRTVRLMGKDVNVTSTDFNSVITGQKAQDTASSSHASSSYCSDGANNKISRSIDYKNCLEMNFGTGQFTPGNYMPANYITTNPGPVISFPMVPSFNFYPQFPVVSPAMISFPLGSSVFPQPYGLNVRGFRDGNNNRDESCRKMGYMK